MKIIQIGSIIICPNCESEEYECLDVLVTGSLLKASCFRHLRGVEIKDNELFDCKKCGANMSDGSNCLKVKK